MSTISSMPESETSDAPPATWKSFQDYSYVKDLPTLDRFDDLRVRDFLTKLPRFL